LCGRANEFTAVYERDADRVIAYAQQTRTPITPSETKTKDGVPSAAKLDARVHRYPALALNTWEDSMLDITRRRLLMSILTAPAFVGLSRALSACARDDDPFIASAADARDVFDFERLARAKLPPAHWGYLKTGVDGDATLHANDAGFANYGLRVRRLVDISHIDTSVGLFGTTWPSPIFLDPVGSQRAFHPDGEIASAKAARARKHLQILSTVASTSLEDVCAARGEPVWYQLYPTDQWPVTAALVRRVEAAGCPVLVLTVDLQGGSNRIALARAVLRDPRDCTACHTSSTRLADEIAPKPMFRGLDVKAVNDLTPPDMSWDYVQRLRDVWPRKLVLKGLVTREDALLAVKHGVDGIIVSNHGGRAEDSGRASIDSLAEVAPAVAGRVPVLLDGGVRRGADVVKALALGATAVGIGRPYIWGLASFGQEGVERVLEILQSELAGNMRQAGTRSLAEINASLVVDRRRP
jgi:isopentenyl diphosphate isomerase/L-lactate dehydrogenase-like FMN-dependent dehydrogenase